ncbi:MAG: lipid IV(A) 3-deoxy-D-manno-octulosonic acid transferase [Xanthomonadales bacterium]|nr:lipid IV(A) 3-deoxy-D-manno-octulosonic acid transferase [Xanthomonadales bacterium]
MRVLYTLALLLVLPLLLGHLALRGVRNRDYLRRWSERFGRGPEPPATGGIVVHAVSVGEINAASPLLRAWMDRSLPLTVTCFTPTGSDRIHALCGARAFHVYLPFDLPWLQRRFLRRLRPRLLVIMETEIWPNLLLEAERAGVPVLMANARLSEQSLKGYRRWRPLVRRALATVDAVCAQSEVDARRLVELGCAPERVVVAGNLKFDVRLPAGVRDKAAAMRESWGAERPVVVAGSSHEAEETVVLEAFERVLATHPDALLVLVPRHPERFAGSSLPWRHPRLDSRQRSHGEAAAPDTRVYLADTMGELLEFYAAGDVAIVGGSLSPVGGHNVLEPAALERPVLVGPHTFKSAEVADRLIDEGGALRVHDATSLADALSALLANAERRERMGRAARQLVASGRGALEHTLAAADRLLDS